MAAVALNAFKRFFHRAARPLQHLREEVAVKQQGTGDFYRAVVYPRGIQDALQFAVARGTRALLVNQIAAAVHNPVQVVSHDLLH